MYDLRANYDVPDMDFSPAAAGDPINITITNGLFLRPLSPNFA
jgi:hypothetical protein